MIERKTKHFLLTSAVCLVILGAVVFTCLASVMREKSEITLNDVSKSYMSGMNDQLQKKFEAVIAMQLKQVEGTVNRVEEGDLAYSDALREELALCAKIRDFSFLALYRQDGTSDVLYGETINLTDQKEFLNMLSQEEVKVSSGICADGEKLFFLAVDVAYPMSDGKESDVLVAGVTMDFLKEILKLDEDGATMFSHIIDHDGYFIVRSGGAYRDSYFERIRAVFSEHQGKTPEQYEKELREAMERDEPYSSCAIIDGKHQNIYCSRLNGTDWHLLSVMPYDTLDSAVSSLDQTRQNAMLTAGGVMLAGFLLVFFLYYRMSRQQLRELRRAEQESAKASQAKSEFLSSMSHDIRTPMNGIVGMTAIARANIGDQAKVADCLGKISMSSKHLLGLINDVLDMSKIESGKLSLNTYMVSLQETMDSIVTIAQPQVKAKHQHFDIFIRDIQTENVYCDSIRLNQVLLNLISNAVKFTSEDGTINIFLEQEDSPKGDDYVRCHFRVKDNGIGMSPEFQKTIFEQFTREQSRQVHQTEGSGLGMAITKAIVEMMEGSIQLQSAPGQGSEFHIVLDFERADMKEADMILPPWKMLVVDDNIDLGKSVVASLKEIGVVAEWASGGKMAIQMARQHHTMGDDYQIILMDWKMPEMDGLQTTKELRRHLGDDVPILIISAYDWSDIEEEARAAGAHGFIAKPLFKSNLFLGLSPFMLQQETEKEKAKEEELRFQGRRILLAEDNDLNWEIAEEILSEAGFCLERAENGKVCVEKFKQSEPGYYDVILMDIRMPVMNGYDAASAIRDLERKDAGLPIIAMTADAFTEDIQRSLACGMNEHIAKPIDLEHLMQILRHYLSGDE